jgi:molybdopterin molybdotransferase
LTNDFHLINKLPFIGHMISAIEAKQLIGNNLLKHRRVLVPLLQSNLCVLAQTIVAPIHTPPFNQSAMDGYAFAFNDLQHSKTFTVKQKIAAGDISKIKLLPGEAARVYTGSPMPEGADTVVMQEKVIVQNSAVEINDENISFGLNVRLQGSQTKKGEVVLSPGILLMPPAISYLASMGIAEVEVYDKPKVSIIVTGKELVKPGQKIDGGKIYESNSFGLIAALNQLNIEPISVRIITDDEAQISNAVKQALHSDILILTGGVSVGDYDFVASALSAAGVEKIFHKVKQKPGKPFYFGRKNDTLVFGLPGNPAAVLTCFYQYIVDAIAHFTQRNYFEKYVLPLANNYEKKTQLTHFMKGEKVGNTVMVLKNQESYLMNSFAMSNCLIEFDAEKENFKAGDLVSIRMIL